MCQPFIRNHQYNAIKKQVDFLQTTVNTVSDPKVVESVRYNAPIKALEAFPHASEQERQLLEKISALSSAAECQSYLQFLEPYRLSFPEVSAKQLAKLYPKVKKLKLPDLETTDYRRITYLGWLDIAMTKMYLVYSLDGKMVGIDGRFTPANKGVCFLCNRHSEVALFTAVSKDRPANASPDYYKAIGNYVCMDSAVCNQNITDVAPLEKFIGEVMGTSK
ncbi:FusB/FusC family EF-G-binding protein [Gorillibacterium massiliense]|uniref:FusB/FusC family EF-G-binding protein n=1 Tax=Gorillibacterium massiliense TaxID=1280390 RepID=UPI0004B206A4|nr:elongation factor G-binding protein [Gorillibacterium massiliense]